MDKPAPNDPLLPRRKREREVLDGALDRWAEHTRLSTLSDRILWDTAGCGQPAVAPFKPVRPEDIHKRTGFMFNVRREGIAL